ncbi:hypothetical protein L1987_58262 [Smallanthus sonchifolius]|uniref:Uncharacterized protein n=1 Tax=Smallanthus sonchifolius TaxID=185202 RepID=A0ACB9DF94_9ASTR|nr:hypothetical protein L1987_58262 [Smallanthus sonchifolius]
MDYPLNLSVTWKICFQHKISILYLYRIALFRNASVDKWQRKTKTNSEQIASYMWIHSKQVLKLRKISCWKCKKRLKRNNYLLEIESF